MSPPSPLLVAGSQPAQTHARPINHVAVSVADIEAVTRWYTEIMGFQVIGGKIAHIKRSEAPSAPIFAIYGDSLNEVKLAYMSTGNGVGFEVFEFVDPSFQAAGGGFEYRRGGFFHVCVTDPDPDALVARILRGGGAKIGATVTLVGGVTCVYVRDPWGHVVEILDASFDRLATMDTAS
ncbi:hypothetical protein NKR23_g6396 [Pleurostoma richardsiae]|uniref:VOC domain-containing protein n=1 Tax=Pleurostoma richardsiae TaxID=41990 RepID=A0AA38RZC0_9PEZI|nr:hypothetical protein NKR23_g6396 [Pleurostoma richardsiae]